MKSELSVSVEECFIGFIQYPVELVTLDGLFFVESCCTHKSVSHRVILGLVFQRNANQTFPVDPRRKLCQKFMGCVACASQGPESEEKSGGAAGRRRGLCCTKQI